MKECPEREAFETGMNEIRALTSITAKSTPTHWLLYIAQLAKVKTDTLLMAVVV
jgi:hypothetical protein